MYEEYDWCTVSQLDRVRNEVVTARTGVRRGFEMVQSCGDWRGWIMNNC